MGDFDKVKYNNDYNKDHYDRVNLLVPKGTKTRWKQAAQIQGKNLSAFVFDLVEADIQSKFPDLTDPKTE